MKTVTGKPVNLGGYYIAPNHHGQLMVGKCINLPTPTLSEDFKKKQAAESKKPKAERTKLEPQSSDYEDGSGHVELETPSGKSVIVAHSDYISDYPGFETHNQTVAEEAE